MPRHVATGLKKVQVSKTKLLELAERRAQWKLTTVNELLSLAYQDWIEVTGSTDGFANYQTHVMDTNDILFTAEKADDLVVSQKLYDIALVEDFFSRVPEDTVLGLLTKELVASIVRGEPTNPYGS